MKKAHILTLGTFMLAIGGAFATKLAAPETGYSRISDIPTQPSACVARVQCDNAGTLDCTFEVGDQDIQLYRLESDNTCSLTPLKRF
jgi:hypothetical protein